jgi:uncharacterized protein (DUF2236 family)
VAVSEYFTDASMIRRVYRERAMVLAGPRALLMQAAHPVAVSGLLAHSSSLEEPYERLMRTAEVMSTVTFGARADADRETKRVRAVHRRVGADDPELLMWVLYTLVDSALVVYDKYVTALHDDAQSALWEDYKVVGKLFGLHKAEMPRDIDDFRAYGHGMLGGDTLCVTDWARTRAREIVLEPPVPLAARPLVEAMNFITVALLPDRIRREYGFRPLPPAWMRRALVAGGAEYVKRAVIPFLPARLRYVPAARAA